MRFTTDDFLSKEFICKKEVQRLLVELKRAHDTIDCFFTGKIPEGADLTMCVLATWGKKRKKEMEESKKSKVV